MTPPLRHRLLALAALIVAFAAPATGQSSTGPGASKPMSAARAVEATVQDAPGATAPGKQLLGTIHKGPVDDAIRALRDRRAGEGFGDQSCRQTAMVLCAMGHCHRFYFLEDGPYMRDAVRYLFRARGKDGDFGDPDDRDPAARAVTTQWVVDALAVIGGKELAADVSSAQRWLARQGNAPTDGFEQRVTALLDRCARENTDPKRLGAAAAAKVNTLMDEAPSKVGNLVEPLIELVVCQTAARRIDSGIAAAKVAAASWSESQAKGHAYLSAVLGHGPLPDLGLAALATAAMQTKPSALRTEAEKKLIDESLQLLIQAQAEDGSIGQRNTNYTTCAAVLALAMAERAEFQPTIQKARDYVLAIQNVESRGYARDDRDYGSIGYGGSQRGDLSNLNFAVEALRASGLGADHEAFAKAIVFLQRTQNLRSVNDFEGRARDEEGNDMEIVSGDDGGAAYYPGNSAAGYVNLPDGKKIPRSYGSMTYALLKTYTLAGLPATDTRVSAAVRWIEQNWTLTENPGCDPALGDARYAGLYYSYLMMSQALSATGIATLRVPGKGETDEALEVDWRVELREHLAKVQKADGSWVNAQNGRWWEDQPVLCTIYSLLALHHAR
jgi:squalene-hopene/tetraprenyl-beta-curcumene cyclase